MDLDLDPSRMDMTEWKPLSCMTTPTGHMVISSTLKTSAIMVDTGISIARRLSGQSIPVLEQCMIQVSIHVGSNSLATMRDPFSVDSGTSGWDYYIIGCADESLANFTPVDVYTNSNPVDDITNNCATLLYPNKFSTPAGI